MDCARNPSLTSSGHCRILSFLSVRAVFTPSAAAGVRSFHICFENIDTRRVSLQERLAWEAFTHEQGDNNTEGQCGRKISVRTAKSAGSDFGADDTMADIEQRQSREMEPAMVLDTTMPETTPAGFTASPLPKTPLVSRPASQRPGASLANFKFGFSQSPSPATSEPASSRPQSAEHVFQEISLTNDPQSQRSSGSQQASAGASPIFYQVSEQRQSIPLASHDVEELPPSPVDSGSDYSEPSTPLTSRPTSFYSSLVVRKLQTKFTLKHQLLLRIVNPLSKSSNHQPRSHLSNGVP